MQYVNGIRSTYSTVQDAFQMERRVVIADALALGRTVQLSRRTRQPCRAEPNQRLFHVQILHVEAPPTIRRRLRVENNLEITTGLRLLPFSLQTKARASGPGDNKRVEDVAKIQPKGLVSQRKAKAKSGVIYNDALNIPLTRGQRKRKTKGGV